MSKKQLIYSLIWFERKFLQPVCGLSQSNKAQKLKIVQWVTPTTTKKKKKERNSDSDLEIEGFLVVLWKNILDGQVQEKVLQSLFLNMTQGPRF